MFAYGVDPQPEVWWKRTPTCLPVAVRLRTSKQEVLNVGTVEMYDHGIGWGRICDGGWHDVDAGVVCRELGFKDGKALCCNQVSV